MADLQFSLKWNKKDLRNLKKMPDKFKSGLLKGFKKAMFYVESKAKRNLSGKVLNVGTGRLRNSIKNDVKVVGDNIIGYVGSNVKYARIHELGGVIKPKVAEYLKFKVNGKWVVTKSVTIPKRPFLKSSFEQSERKIKQIIVKEIEKSVKQ